MKGHTRITDSSATLIDLAFTNKPESNGTSYIEYVGIGNHVVHLYSTKNFNTTKTTKTCSYKAI